MLASPLYVRDGYYAGMPSLPLADAADAEALSKLSRRWRVHYILWQDLDLGLSLDAGSSGRGLLDHVRPEIRGDREALHHRRVDGPL